MPIKKVGYKEPASYFNADMRKAAREWDKEHKQQQKQEQKKQAEKKKK